MKKLLIYEDDEDTLVLCKLVLSKLNINVIGFDSCKAVFDQIRQFNPDGILLDYWLPGNGGATCLSIKQSPEFSHIPVILYSTHNDILDKANIAKADYCVQKPFDIDVLRSIVKQALKL